VTSHTPPSPASKSEAPAVSAVALLRLRVVAEPDPGALARVIERFQNLNVVPRRIVAEHSTTGAFHICVDVLGVPEQMLTLITAKIGQVPSVLSAHWHHA
jgi:hypothetical protein